MATGTPPRQTGASTAWTPAPTLETVLFQGQFLRQGHQGPAVSELQRLLGLTPDGKFGTVTRVAVEAFQKAVHMAPTSDAAAASPSWTG